MNQVTPRSSLLGQRLTPTSVSFQSPDQTLITPKPLRIPTIKKDEIAAISSFFVVYFVF